MKQTERAWAAGFFDGEGCISRRLGGTPTSPHLYPFLSIGQTDKRVLERFKNAAPGIRQGIGGPYFRKTVFKQKPMYTLQVNGLGPVQTVIGAMWPYLGEVKKEQFKRVMMEVSNYTAVL